MSDQQELNITFNLPGFTKASMLISILGLWIIRFPLAYVLSYNTSLEHIGIWMAFPISNLLAAIVAFTYYKFGHWKKRVIMYTHDLTVLKSKHHALCHAYLRLQDQSKITAE